jgi:hypothetical protein
VGVFGDEQRDGLSVQLVSLPGGEQRVVECAGAFVQPRAEGGGGLGSQRGGAVLASLAVDSEVLRTGC